MLTILILVVGSMTVLVVLLLVIVVIGIRQEPPTEELSEQAPSLTTVFVRRLLGVYVRKPTRHHVRPRSSAQWTSRISNER